MKNTDGLQMNAGEKPINIRLLKAISLLIRLSAIVPSFFAILFVLTTQSDGDSPGALMMVLCAGGIASLLLFAAGSMIRLVLEISTNLARILEKLQTGEEKQKD